MEASEESCPVLLQALSQSGDMLGPFGRLEPPSAKEIRAHSPSRNTHGVKVPSPLRFVARPVQPEISRPSGHSILGSSGNPLKGRGLNPRGGHRIGQQAPGNRAQRRPTRGVRTKPKRGNRLALWNLSEIRFGAPIKCARSRQ